MRLGSIHTFELLNFVDHKLIEFIRVLNRSHDEDVGYTPAGIGHPDAR